MRRMFNVADANQKEFVRILKAVNKVLKSNGKGLLVPVDCGPVSILQKSEGGIKAYAEGRQYSIDYPDELVRFDGLSYVGGFFKVEGAWRRSMSSELAEDLAYVSEENFRCDGCRRHIGARKAYYFFRRREGGYLVFGKGCANAAVGYDCESLLRKLAWFHEKASELSALFAVNEDYVCFEPSCVAGFTSLVTDGFSTWKKRNEDGEGTGTVREIRSHLRDDSEPFDIPGWDRVLADARKFWDDDSSDSDLAVNSRKALSRDVVPARWVGTYAYAIWKSENAKIAARSARDSSRSDFVGKPGERLTAEVSLIKSSRYGKYDPFSRQMVENSRLLMEDSSGNEYVCFCTSMRTIARMEGLGGSKARCSFTVKDHEEYRGVRRTVVNRMAFK